MQPRHKSAKSHVLTQSNCFHFQSYEVFLSLKIVLILENSADPDEMPLYVAFHLGPQCLPKYPFRGFQYIKEEEE